MVAEGHLYIERHGKIPLGCTIFFLLAIIPAFAKITIKGSIQNYDGKSIVYYQPTLEGIFSPYWKETKPSASGLFVIEFENKGFGTTTVGYQGALFRFFHDENSSIYLALDQGRFIPRNQFSAGSHYYDSLRTRMTLKIDGDYRSVNLFYNSVKRTTLSTTRSVSGNYYSNLVLNGNSPGEVNFLIDSLMNSEIAKIEGLPLSISLENPTLEKRREEIHDFLISEVRAFYGTVFLQGMFLKRKEEVILAGNNPLKISNTKYGPEWVRSTEDFLNSWRKNLWPAANSRDYNEFIEAFTYTKANYKTYFFPQSQTSNQIDSTVTYRLLKEDSIYGFDPATAFAYRLGGLHIYLQSQLYYSPALLNAIYSLEEEHKSSQHLQFYQPQIDKLKAYVQSQNKTFDKAKIINKNHTTFASILNDFKGKNLLIDIWATWCHPCIEDFRYKSAIEPYVKAGKLEVLYVSIDKPASNERWRQSIRFNELAGYHFRGNIEFIESMWAAIGGEAGAIPRYVLVDSDGRIFMHTAPRPSRGAELVAEVERLISK